MVKDDYLRLSYWGLTGDLKKSIWGKEYLIFFIVMLFTIVLLMITFPLFISGGDSYLIFIISGLPFSIMVIFFCYKMIKKISKVKKDLKLLMGHPINIEIDTSFIGKYEILPMFDFSLSLYDNGFLYNISLFAHKKPLFFKNYYKSVFFYKDIEHYELFSGEMGIKLRSGEKYLLDLGILKKDKDYLSIIEDKFKSNGIVRYIDKENSKHKKAYKIVGNKIEIFSIYGDKTVFPLYLVGKSFADELKSDGYKEIKD